MAQVKRVTGRRQSDADHERVGKIEEIAVHFLLTLPTAGSCEISRRKGEATAVAVNLQFYRATVEGAELPEAWREPLALHPGLPERLEAWRRHRPGPAERKGRSRRPAHRSVEVFVPP